jgi:hypothetical protein
MPPPNRKLMPKGGIKNDVGGKVSLQKYIQWTYLISAGPVLTLYLAHSHCDKKYVNLSK